MPPACTPALPTKQKDTNEKLLYVEWYSSPMPSFLAGLSKRECISSLLPRGAETRGCCEGRYLHQVSPQTFSDSLPTSASFVARGRSFSHGLNKFLQRFLLLCGGLDLITLENILYDEKSDGIERETKLKSVREKRLWLSPRGMVYSTAGRKYQCCRQ